MNKNVKIKNLKNTLAFKTIMKTIFMAVICALILNYLVDGLYNDEIANELSLKNQEFYLFCLRNKSIIFTSCYIIIFSIFSFINITNMNKKILSVTLSVDNIINDSSKEITLPKDLLLLENKLNSIRLDLIQKENERKEAIERKNDLIMYMAHDLKTPLTSVIGYLTLLNEEKELSSKIREKYISIALNKSIRVEELTNEFFEITRYNLQKIEINKKEIDLSLLIEQLKEECYPLMKEKNLDCKITCRDKVMFKGDGNKLARAFENLMKNAINYSYVNTEILINITETENEIKIIFKNKSDKIPNYKLDKIFEKFYRVDEARNAKTGGSGLGLAITKEIIELHGGKIYVRNNDEYVEFHIELKKSSR